jgi:hypothetical protein
MSMDYAQRLDPVEVRPEGDPDTIGTSRVTVGQPGQVSVSVSRNSHVPHQADVKVGAERPRPEAPQCVVLRLADTPPRQLRCEGHLKQRRVNRGPT